jgi:CelD/BcsL family acetyltransferase involved in cellulose biosynthesis
LTGACGGLLVAARRDGTLGAGFVFRRKYDLSRSSGSLTQGTELRILRSQEELSDLERDWDDLARRCPGYFLSQTFMWAQVAWETVARPRGRTLHIVTLCAEARLVALWPLVVYREHGLDILRPLGSESSEYSAPLVEPGDLAEHYLDLIWQAAAASADWVVLPHVRAESLFARVIERQRRRIFAEDDLPAPFVARRDFADWEAYQATVDARWRSKIRRTRRRLGELGKVTLEPEASAAASALIDWMIEHKKLWLARTDVQNDWLGLADYRDFLAESASRRSSAGSVALFVLKLDGVPIAAHFCCVDPCRVEYLIGAFDAAWTSYGAGQIVTEYGLRWAFEHGLDYDFRIGAEGYKYKWATRSCATSTLHIATSWRGLPALARLHVKRTFGLVRRKLALGRFLRPA